MEPERRDTYTHIERDRRGSGMAFIVGGLVVAVLVIALVVWGGPFGTWQGDDADIEVSTQTEVPGAVENEVQVESGAAEGEPAEVEVEQEAAPAAPAEPETQN